MLWGFLGQHHRAWVHNSAFSQTSPNQTGKVKVCGLYQLVVYGIEGLLILNQRKSPLLEDGPRMSNTSHLAKWPWDWGCPRAEMVIAGSWPTGDSEAMCLPRDRSDCIPGKKKKLEPTTFFTQRREPPWYRRAKTNSFVLVFSCEPVRPSAAASLHHTG